MSAIITPVGVADRKIDLFENQYPVPFGMLYNSYVVAAPGAVAVVDAVEHGFAREWLDNVRTAIGEGKTPDYLIVLHLEPDHSGSIADAMAAFPDMRLVMSAKAAAMLPDFFPEAKDWASRIIAVGESQQIELGGDSKLTFLSAPMVHWPEVMVAYEHSSKSLFSADAFGTFGTNAPQPFWLEEAGRYYFNICGKFGPQVQALLKKAASLDIHSVYPLHGPILQGDGLARAMEVYGKWSLYEPDIDGVLIPYASIYGHTAEAAEMFAEMLRSKGVHAEAINLARCDMSRAVGMAFRYSRMVLAAATYDAGVFTPMADFLHRLQAKTYRNRRVGLIQNGSWAPTAAIVIKKILETMKGIEIVEPVVTVNTRLNAKSTEALQQLADALH